jgi:hypothetical protein
VGNWVERKGLLDLLAAVAALPAAAATLHLAGRDDGDRAYTARVRARLAQPDLAGRMIVHGPLDRNQVSALPRRRRVRAAERPGALRHRLGAAARRRAEDLPTWEESAARLFATLHAAADGRPAG